MKTIIMVLVLSSLLVSCTGGGGASGGNNNAPATVDPTPTPTAAANEVFPLDDVVSGYVAPKDDMGDFKLRLSGLTGAQKELIKGQIATAENENETLSCWVDIEYMNKYVKAEGTNPNMNIYIVYVSNTVDYPANIDECTNLEGKYEMEIVNKYSLGSKFTILE